MTTILHSIDTGGPGGAETVFATLASAEDRGFRSIALAKPGGWVEETLRKRGVDAVFTNPSGSFNRRYLQTIITTIRSNGVRLVQSHLYGSNVYCAIAGRLCGVPVVSVFHGAQDLVAPGLANGIKRQIVQRGSTALVTVSRTLREQLIQAGFRDNERLRTIHNGIDIARFESAAAGDLRRSLGIPNDTVLLGAVGNIRGPKGYEVLVEALANMPEPYDNCHLVIAGQGKGRLLDDLRRQIDSSGLAGRVHLPGFVQDTPAFFNSIDVYVSSSHSEGFSLSCVEAMASGTPVVATRSGGPEEILTDKETGLLVAVNKADDLQSAICETLDDRMATQARIMEARRTAINRFSVAAMVSNYHELYRELLGNSGDDSA